MGGGESELALAINGVTCKVILFSPLALHFNLLKIISLKLGNFFFLLLFLADDKLTKMEIGRRNVNSTRLLG